MGPKTMNATSEPGVKLAPSEAAMKASAEEQTQGDGSFESLFIATIGPIQN